MNKRTGINAIGDDNSMGLPPIHNLNVSNQTVQHDLQQLKIKTTLINNDYSITDKVLGLGINGKVVECRSKVTGQKFAIKVLKDNSKSRREVDLHWRASRCKHIVPVIDVYENTISGKKCLFIIMEW